MFLYIHPESGSAFVSVEQVDPNKNIDAAHCELVCECLQNWPRSQAEFEAVCAQHGITNGSEFKYSVVPHFPEGSAAGVLQGSVEAAAELPPSEPKPTRQRKAQQPTVEAPTEVSPQTIVKLSVSNVKRLSAVEITPEGSVVTVGGKNGAGKSSVLDAIQMALGGKDSFPEKPIRDGEKSAKIICETEDFIVTRSITPSGGTLVVSSKDGARFSTPQQLLDRLTGKLTFDPLAFTRMSPKEQLETLKKLVGIDFTEEDNQRKQLYDERTLRGRELQQAQAVLAQTPHHANAGTEESNIADLSKQLLEVQAWNQKRAGIVAKIDGYAATIQSSNQRINDLNAQIDALVKRRIAEEDAITAAESMKTAFEAGLAAMPVKDDAPVTAAIQNLESVNRKVRENRAHAEAEKKVQDCNASYDQLTEAIKYIDDQKSKRLSETKFPVPGLSFDESGVLVNNLPFAQASSAEQIRVSVAMGLALNPTLKVILIRDGSLLDANSLSLVSQMAKNSGAQCWIEKVSETGEGCQVIIEDGRIKL